MIEYPYYDILPFMMVFLFSGLFFLLFINLTFFNFIPNIGLLILTGGNSNNNVNETEDKNVNENKESLNSKEYKVKHKPTGGFAERVGQKILDYMIELSTCGDKEKVIKLSKKIAYECDKLLSNGKLDYNRYKIINTVRTWIDNFKVDRHIADIIKYGSSAQIIYDKKKMDFQLRITAK